MPTIKPAKGSSTADLRASRAKYPTAAPCRNPLCQKRVVFNENVRGTPALFCSDRCRTEFSRSRRALKADVSSVLASLETQPPQGKVARELKGQLTHIRWLLAAYGGDD
jgi:hypothetical protein